MEKYDHENQSFTKAIGLNEKEMYDLMEQFIEFLNSENKSRSEVVEQIENKFSNLNERQKSLLCFFGVEGMQGVGYFKKEIESPYIW